MLRKSEFFVNYRESYLKILFLSHASIATGFVVGSHQLARQYILQGHQVQHVSSPVSFVNMLKGKQGRIKVKTSLLKSEKMDHWGFIDRIPFLPFPYGYSHKLDRINNVVLLRYLTKINFDNVDLVLIDQPLFYGVLPLIKSKNIIYRPTDIYTQMGGERFELPESLVFKYTHSVIATSKPVLSNLQKYKIKQSLVLNNGVDTDFFSKGGAGLKQLNREGCVYVGAVDFRFDLDFVKAIALKYSEIQFDIYGPCSIELGNYPSNLTFYGGLSYFELPGVLAKYRVGLLPLNEHPGNKGRSPMKLWEYQSSGLVVYKRVFENNPNCLIGMFSYKENQEGVEKLRDIYEKSQDINSTELIDQAQAHSWKRISEKILSFVSGV